MADRGTDPRFPGVRHLIENSTQEINPWSMDRAFSENSTALAELKKMEEHFDATLGEAPLRGSDEDYDKLIEEVRKLKREGRKIH